MFTIRLPTAKSKQRKANAATSTCIKCSSNKSKEPLLVKPIKIAPCVLICLKRIAAAAAEATEAVRQPTCGRHGAGSTDASS